MANRERGESEIEVAGEKFTLCLTLGALAEIEDALGLQSFSEIGTRIESLKTVDLAKMFLAMLKGGGHTEMTIEDVLKLPIGVPQIMQVFTEQMDVNSNDGKASLTKPPSK